MSGRALGPAADGAPTMVIGILQFDVLVRGAESLKDKRRVVCSLKDRLHREHLVSIAEVGMQDVATVARLGLALVGSDGRHVGQTLDRITAKLRSMTDAELGDVTRELIEGRGPEACAPGGADEALDSEMLDRARALGQEGGGW